jgi:ankyrin repeat protein
MLLWSVYFNQTLIRDFLLARLAADSVTLDIFEAAAVGNLPELQSSLQADPDAVNSYSGDGWTPLHLASAFATPAAVSALLAAHAPVHAVSRNPQQNQPLHAAVALSKDAVIIGHLLEHGASPNAVQAGGFTPIFSAATANRRDLAKLLLAHGADPHVKSDGGKTAAEFALQRGHHEMAAWLESLPGA